MGAKCEKLLRQKPMAMIIVPLTVAKDMLTSLHGVPTGVHNIFRGDMALVVLAHKGMSKSTLCHRPIKTSRQ